VSKGRLPFRAPWFNLVLGVCVPLATPVLGATGDLAGCYELQLTKWSPAISLGEDEIFISPPSRIILTSTPDDTWEKHAYRAAPVDGAAPWGRTHSYWTSSAQHVHIVWTTGFSGLRMDLKAQGADLIGTAQTFWDFSRPQQSSHVTATRVSCEPTK
jgi:hypothetical protein